MFSFQKIKEFQEKVLSFYEEEGRDLPWRKTSDPYAILLSEVMLQQTQVNRGIIYFQKWLEQWPTVFDLARADRADVLKAWMGLGYNMRALRLHTTMKIIASQFDGDILKALEEYKKLPGIGKYSAAAVKIFSTNCDAVTVDTNIRRIFIHEFSLSEDVSEKELWDLAWKCLPKGKSRDWHNALMDYGSLVLTSQKTKIKAKTRQSRFEGSDRQLRAKILRFVLEKKEVSFEEMYSFGKKDKVERVLNSLEKDQLLVLKDRMYILK